MARNFLTAVNLNKNELQNPVIHNLAAAPSSPAKGQMYMDTVANILYWWDGTAWQSASGGASFPGYGSVPAETTFGIAKADGVATTVARSDHTHGSPTHDAAAHSTIPLSALAAPTADISMAGFSFFNLPQPALSSSAVPKSYVDAVINGLSWKDAVRCATIVGGNITLSGNQAIDGVTTVTGDRVLVKNQTAPAENGIYVAGAGAWSRALDADAGTELEAAAVLVTEGTTQQDTGWVCTANAPITVGTTALAWAQFAGGGTIVGGNGITQAGNTLSIVSGDSSIAVAADTIAVANNGVQNSQLADMPLLTIKGNNTGATGDPLNLTTAQVRAMLGTPVKFASAITGGATSETFTHNLNTRDVSVQVYRTATPYDTVECDVERTSVNQLTLRFATAPAAGEYTVVVIG